MQLPDVSESFVAQSAEAQGLGPGEFGRFLSSERDNWADLVKRSGAKVGRCRLI
jgi:tripartite-type tricarboxylate transporter receptor subunit TctC